MWLTDRFLLASDVVAPATAADSCIVAGHIVAPAAATHRAISFRLGSRRIVGVWLASGNVTKYGGQLKQSDSEEVEHGRRGVSVCVLIKNTTKLGSPPRLKKDTFGVNQTMNNTSNSLILFRV